MSISTHPNISKLSKQDLFYVIPKCREKKDGVDFDDGLTVDFGDGVDLDDGLTVAVDGLMLEDGVGLDDNPTVDLGDGVGVRL